MPLSLLSRIARLSPASSRFVAALGCRVGSTVLSAMNGQVPVAVLTRVAAMSSRLSLGVAAHCLYAGHAFFPPCAGTGQRHRPLHRQLRRPAVPVGRIVGTAQFTRRCPPAYGLTDDRAQGAEPRAGAVPLSVAAIAPCTDRTWRGRPCASEVAAKRPDGALKAVDCRKLKQA